MVDVETSPSFDEKRLFYKLHLSFKGTALEPTRKGCPVTTGVQSLQHRDPFKTYIEYLLQAELYSLYNKIK